MKNHVPLRVAASAAAVVGGLALAGTAAAKHNARSGASRADRVHLIRTSRDHHHGRRLLILGTYPNDKIALRLDPARRDVLDVDLGNDGTADFNVHLESIGAITVDAGAGDDLVRIDDSDGAFTTSIPTTIIGR